MFLDNQLILSMFHDNLVQYHNLGHNDHEIFQQLYEQNPNHSKFLCL
ncbi:unnamed protein product [Schistosoma curassoni]|uniref:Myosin motor domain-containing protein n=1 Tax=Schistosoma curassoni TaxID=6186 RepID=A0A183KXJ7_9TREM|nr:unnamed protein product [Schistosoma curassoni]